MSLWAHNTLLEELRSCVLCEMTTNKKWKKNHKSVFHCTRTVRGRRVIADGEKTQTAREIHFGSIFTAALQRSLLHRSPRCGLHSRDWFILRGGLDRQVQLELMRDFVLRIELIGKVDSPQATVGVNLPTKNTKLNQNRQTTKYAYEIRSTYERKWKNE